MIIIIRIFKMTTCHGLTTPNFATTIILRNKEFCVKSSDTVGLSKFYSNNKIVSFSGYFGMFNSSLIFLLVELIEVLLWYKSPTKVMFSFEMFCTQFRCSQRNQNFWIFDATFLGTLFNIPTRRNIHR
jgi:hypothetical protein